MALINNFEPVQSIVKKRKVSRQTANLRYPSNLGSHAVILNFKQYDYGNTNIGRASINNTKSIVLPLPGNLTDTFSVNVGSQELGLSGQLVAETITKGAFQTGRDSAEAAANSIKNLYDAANGGDASVSDRFKDAASSWKIAGGFFARSGIDSLSPAVGTGVDVATGNTVNPHVTLNFDGMNLKNHTFSWTFAPESPEDSNQLRRVVNTIKQASLPSYKNVSGTNTNTFVDRALLTYPDLVDIFFVGIDQRYFYYFKPCMIQNFTTDFAPEGLAFVQGGKPSVVNMSIQLSEARIHTREDYEDEIIGGGGR